MTIANPGAIADVATSGPIAVDWGNAIRDRVVNNYATAAARDAAITSPVVGQLCTIDNDAFATLALQQYAGATDGWRPPWNVPWGIVATPTATGSSGTATSAATETRDAVMGNYVFTAVANRRYRVWLTGSVDNWSIANDLFALRIRDGGSSTPTASSTLLAATNLLSPVAGGPGQGSGLAVATFTATAGTHTLSAFAVRISGTGVLTPGGNRELYVEDIGPAGAPS